jgi:hypothetical protein
MDVYAFLYAFSSLMFQPMVLCMTFPTMLVIAAIARNSITVWMRRK